MKLASIELVTEVNPHSNADKLDVVKVLGYNCIVSRDAFKVGDAVVLIQPDTVLPDKPWAEMFKKRSSRVRAMRLRGQWSFGIVMSPYEVCELSDLKGLLLPSNIGKDISDRIGVTKYEAPQPQHLDAKGPLPFGLVKTDEERFQNIEDLPYGEIVEVSLKIDGQSGTYYCCKDPRTNEWVSGICSRGLEMKVDSNNNYTRVNKLYDILPKLEAYCKHHNVGLAIRGELYGKGIQSFSKNPHSQEPLSFAAFSVFNIDTHEYENTNDRFYFKNVCALLDIPTVPIIKLETLTPEVIKYYAEEIDELNGQPFEGVVVKHSKGSFKILNLLYDSTK